MTHTELPCIDCITLPICKQQIDVKTPYLRVRSIIKLRLKCSLLDAYIVKYIASKSTYEEAKVYIDEIANFFKISFNLRMR